MKVSKVEVTKTNLGRGPGQVANALVLPIPDDPDPPERSCRECFETVEQQLWEGPPPPPEALTLLFLH